jgi:hypothetical protein
LKSVQANAACIGVGLDIDHIIIERDQFGRRIPELKVGHIPASSTAAEDEVREAAAAAEATAAAAGKKPKCFCMLLLMCTDDYAHASTAL